MPQTRPHRSTNWGGGVAEVVEVDMLSDSLKANGLAYSKVTWSIPMTLSTLGYSQFTQHSTNTVANMLRIPWRVKHNLTIASTPVYHSKYTCLP